MIKISRRDWIAGAMASTALLCARSAAAQAYPPRAVRIMGPYAPGGGTDVFSRLLAAQMEREFGQTLVIDNRGGGGSTIGTQAVANAQPDGYTIGMVDSAFVTNPGLFKDKLPYDTRRDFIPVSLLSRTQLVLSVSPSSPFKTAQELIAFAKANPGKLTFASAGIGTGIHLAAEQFRQVTGIEIVIIPYRGGAPALADFLSGKVDFTFGAVPSIREHMLAGRARGATAGYSEHGGARICQRRLRERDGPDRAGGDAGAHRGEVAAGGSEHRQEPRVQPKSARAWVPADRQHDGRVSLSRRPRDRKMDPHHRGRKYQAGIVALWRLLASVRNRDALHLDHHLRLREALDGDRRARREILAEQLAAQFGHAGGIARVDQKHRHRDHVAELRARLGQCLLDIAEGLLELGIEVGGERLAGIIDLACMPGDVDGPAAAFGDHTWRECALHLPGATNE